MISIRRLFCISAFCLITRVLAAQSGERSEFPLLIGADDGLYGLSRSGTLSRLWTGNAATSSVKKILRAENFWALLTGEGIVVSGDLRNWEARNAGLPIKTIKLFEKGQKSFVRLVQEIKDFEIEKNGEAMLIAFKDAVYLSRNAGRNWESLSMPSPRTNGIKAVALARLPELTVFAAHSIYGISYRIVGGSSPSQWTEMNSGIEKLETTGNPDEVSDIAVSVSKTGKTTLYAAQTFRRRLYQLDWERKRWTPLWSDKSAFGTVDSLDVQENTLRFVQNGAVAELATASLQTTMRPDLRDFIKRIPVNLGLTPSCLFMTDSRGASINLSELWLVHENNNPRVKAASGKAGIYLPVNHAVTDALLNPYLDLIDKRGIDMLVIDMKDDYGRLRFTPQNVAIAEKGRVYSPVDIDRFLSTMKARGVYVVARIVAFKDPELAKKDNGKYAVWDSNTGKAWVGYNDRRQKKSTEKQAAGVEVYPSSDPDYEIVRTYIDERWVDPYAEEVWEYNAAIAAELQARGFDEIQFDYIRFPTDGDNLANARYRWRDAGMDMDSAILSFLRHVRSRISVPISIDIYGANGWYRTGARTGQEVELLAPYVDIICPMYYPSHFEQDFLAQSPADQRPYRIYYIGTGRAATIARNQVIIRPWAQAFYLNVSYDRVYYNETYVRLQIEGVRDAGAPGYTYWNNSGRYDDIPLKKP
jgi:hypothetical protein